MTDATPFSLRRPSRCLAALLATSLYLAPNLAQAQDEPQAKAAPTSIPLSSGADAAASRERPGAGNSATAGGTIPLPPGAVAARKEAAGDRPIAIGGARAAEQPAADAPPPPLAAALWPVDNSRVQDGDVVLHGESDSLAFDLFVPPGADTRTLTIKAVSSAFIHPQRSVLRAYVGDVLVGEAALQSITDPETLSFDLPADLLKPGFSVVRLEADLAHRLYCGADAAYDLWARIDLSGSGVLQGTAARGASPEAFLAAASLARASDQPILVRARDGAPTEEQVTRIARDLARAMGGGLRFAVEAAETTAGPAPAIVEIRTSPSASVGFRAGPGGSQVVRVSTTGDRVPALFDGARQRTEREAVLLDRDVAVPLGDLGFQTARISDNLWRESVPFELPSEWLTNVKKRAVLDLDFGHVAGMPVGSELRVLVNDTVVRLVPLDRGARFDSAPLEVRFDAALLQAGRNLLQFEVSVPGAPADQPCIASGDGRIEINESSALTVPSSPSMHMPGLVRWMSLDGPVEIAIPRGLDLVRDADLLALGYGLDAALNRDAAGTSPDGTARRLVVLRSADLSRAAFGDVAIGGQTLLMALQPPREAPRTAPEVAPIGVAEAGILGTLPATLSETAGDVLAELRRLVLPNPASELADWLSRANGQAILFQLDSETTDDAYLLLSNHARPDAVATAIESAARWGVPLSGHLALLDWDGAWSTWTDPTRLPVLEDEISERNWPDVVGNFASSRPRLFVGALVGLALFSILLANSYLAASRRQR